MRRLRDTLPIGAGHRAQTRGELVARVGRLALWLAVVVVLVRGTGSVLDGGRARSAVRVERVSLAAGWPDDAARAFAVEFASAYLSYGSGEDPAAYGRRLAGLASPQIAGELAPRVTRRAPVQVVRAATVAAATRVDDGHALVTVAVTIAARRDVNTRQVVVPVARDGAGGLVVDDLPSFAPAPARAAVAPAQGEPLVGPERGAIADVLARFLRAYLAGDTAGLAYLVPPGTRVRAAGGLELVELGSVVAAAPAPADVRERVVLVGVRARDLRSRTAYALRYRVRLVRRDRWYVAEINGRGAGKR